VVAQLQDQGLSKQEKLTKGLAAYHAELEKIRKSNPQSALLTAKAIAQGEAVVRRNALGEETKPRAARGGIGAPTDNELATLQAKIAGVKEELAWGQKLNEGEKEALRIQQQLTFVTDSKIRQKLQLKLLSAQEYAGLLDVASAAKEYTEATKKQDEANKREIAQATQQAVSWENKVQFYGRGESALNRYALSQLEATIAEKEALATRMQDTGELAKEIKLLKEKAEILGRTVTAQENFEGLEAADKAAKDFADARKKEADDMKGAYTGVFQSMEDAAVGFFSGTSVSAKKMFDSMISDLIRYQIRQSFTQPLMGAMGGGGFAGLLGKVGGAVAGLFGTPAGGGSGLAGAVGPTSEWIKPSFSAAGGFDIPSGINPIVQAHAEEMILPAQISRPLKAMLANGGATGASGEMHLHISPTIDARGADAAALARLEGVVATMVENLKPMVLDTIRGAQLKNRQSPGF
jgi:hypothetical protein